MPIWAAVAASLAWSGFFVLIVVWAPFVGLRNHPRASLVAAIVGAAFALAVVLIQVVAGLTLSTSPPAWGALVASYLLAVGHRLVDGPYPFSWGPRWLYQIGSLRSLIPVGAVLAIAAGYSARRYARRTALLIVALACGLIAAYVGAAWYVAANLLGIPL